MTALPTGLVFRKAAPGDYAAVAAFFALNLNRYGVPHDITHGKLRALTGDHRLNLVLAADRIIAALWAVPAQTACPPTGGDTGRAFKVAAIAVDPAYHDPVLALDLLCFASLNRAAAEGAIIIAKHDTRVPTVTGVDLMGMEGQVEGVDPATGKPLAVRERGDPAVMFEAILKRRPQWRTLL